MKRLYCIITFLYLTALLTYGQNMAEKVPPGKENAAKKEIKNVPSAEVKSKPTKISSAARPSGIRSNQPGKTVNASTGKPEGAGKPSGTGNPANSGRPSNPGRPAGTGKPPGI
jgi:hypothetical protein